MYAMMKVTDYCNMCCTYCYVPAEQRMNKEYMSLDYFPSVFRKMFDWQQSEQSSGTLTMCWSGGEVLSLPCDWWKEMIKIQNSTYESGDYTFKRNNCIQTNMTLLTDKLFEFFQEHKISIGISFDGPQKCMDKTRILKNGQSAFDIILDKLKHLKEKYKITPGAIVVLSKCNVGYIEDVWKFFNDLKMGFQVNSYHYAPSSTSSHVSNQITSQEYLSAMCHLFNLWSECPSSQSNNITDFKRIIDFLLYGKTGVCQDTPSCATSFYMVRWNGDVYPCNEFSGAIFEQDYCYGNLIKQDWREIRDHPTRQILMERAQKILDSTAMDNKCKNCRYWKGCHGGCFHCALKNQYYNNGDYSPKMVASLYDPEHCAIKYGLYRYIENKLKIDSEKHFLPILLYPDRVSVSKKRQRKTFYNYHKQLWKAAHMDSQICIEKLSSLQQNLLKAQLRGKKNILHICCGSTSLIDNILQENPQNNVLGVDYRFYNGELLNNKNIVKCNDIINWDGWQSKQFWDAILIPVQFIFSEDVTQLLLCCNGNLQDNGVILLYSTINFLKQQGLFDVASCEGVRKYQPNVCSINCDGISVVVLNKYK